MPAPAVPDNATARSDPPATAIKAREAGLPSAARARRREIARRMSEGSHLHQSPASSDDEVKLSPASMGAARLAARALARRAARGIQVCAPDGAARRHAPADVCQ